MSIFKSLFGKKKTTGATAVMHESMYSSAYTLKSNPEELLLRIHPIKRDSYLAILKGEAQVEQNGQTITISDVILVVNDGDTPYEIPFSKIANKEISHVKSTTPLSGFDANGEPIVYEMNDNTIRLVFSHMPPVDAEKDNFSMDKFSEDLVEKVGGGMWHDDREIFHVPSPTESTVADIKAFVEGYRK